MAVQFQAQLEHVAADRIFDARGGVGLFYRAGVARILKMIE